MFYKLRKPPPERIEVTELDDEDVALLRGIYSKKRNFVFRATLGLMGLWILAYWRLAPLVYAIFRYKIWKMPSHYGWLIPVLLIVGGLLCGFVVQGMRMYYRHVYLVGLDIRERSGAYVAKEVIRKSIPYDGRYFFFFDDLKTPHIEVDAATYYRFEPGDTYWVLRSFHSRILLGKYWDCALV